MAAREGIEKLNRFMDLVAADIQPHGRPMQLPGNYENWMDQQIGSDTTKGELVSDALVVGSLAALARRYGGLEVGFVDEKGIQFLPRPLYVCDRQRNYIGKRLPIVNAAYKMANLVSGETGVAVPQLTHTGLKAIGEFACGRRKGVKRALMIDTGADPFCLKRDDGLLVILLSNFDAIEPPNAK